MKKQNRLPSKKRCKSRFRGWRAWIDLEIDYDVVSAADGSLDFRRGAETCQDCFLSKVGLYSPLSDELIGIGRDRLFLNFSSDMRKMLFTQSRLCRDLEPKSFF